MAKKRAKRSIIQVAKSASARALIKKLIRYAKPYGSKILLGFLCMIVVAATTAASAKLMKPIINDIFLGRKEEMLLPITGLIFLVFFLKGLFTYGESVLMAFVGHRVIADVQKDFFNVLIQADLKFYQKRQTGDLVSRFMNDVGRLNNAVTGTLSSIGKDFLTLIFFIIVMFDEDWQLASVVFFILPIAILPVIIIGRKMRKTSTKVQEHTSDLTILLTQAFQGVRLVKSYCMEAYEKSKMSEVIENVFERTLKGVRTKAVSHPVMEFLGGIAIAVVILYGGSEVIKGTHTPGAFFTFITALIMSYEPLKRLANLNANLQEQLAAADRVFALMAHKNEIIEQPDAKDLIVTKGSVTFKEVNFSYDDEKDNQPVLQHISLTLKPGQRAALVGPSGGGKSTLMNLIPRFFDVNSGGITVDAQDIRNVTLDSLRHAVALVSQEVVLFDDTIAANIAFGRPGASLEDIIKAAKAAAAHDFIKSLPKGYETFVGEQGMRLSGGQRQRLSIARAFLKNAPVLLMDEPTSALDSESEEKIQSALELLMKGRTTLTIAHRLATVRSADVIYVLEDGVITDRGSHETLLKTSKRYQQLSRIQFQEATSPQDSA
ncbi:MAG: ABC transporter ATP-binding protein/permease [Alphaproteobacteria bacterium]|nr:ABC transporter ATP-binding protein/permease [Alphaproteobacteria bacterium]